MTDLKSADGQSAPSAEVSDPDTAHRIAIDVMIDGLKLSLDELDAVAAGAVLHLPADLDRLEARLAIDRNTIATGRVVATPAGFGLLIEEVRLEAPPLALETTEQ